MAEYISDIDYQIFVEKLISPESLKSEESKFATLGLGLSGELGEILLSPDTEIKSELGDMLWYITYGCIILDIQLSDLIKYAPSMQYTKFEFIDQIINLGISIGQVSELIKKYLYHKKDLDKTILISRLAMVLYNIVQFATMYSIPIRDIKQYNFEKLSQRYLSGKFNVNDFLKKENNL